MDFLIFYKKNFKNLFKINEGIIFFFINELCFSILMIYKIFFEKYFILNNVCLSKSNFFYFLVKIKIFLC